MTDRALSEEAMRTSLRDITLPAEAAGGWLADAAMTVALAGAAALLLAALLRLISQRRHRARIATTADRIAALRDLPDPDRRVALMHLMRARAPERYAAIAGDIYRRDGALDLAALEAEVARIA